MILPGPGRGTAPAKAGVVEGARASSMVSRSGKSSGLAAFAAG